MTPHHTLTLRNWGHAYLAQQIALSSCRRWRQRRYVVTNVEVCARFSSLETRLIQLKLLTSKQLSKRSIVFFSNLTVTAEQQPAHSGESLNFPATSEPGSGIVASPLCAQPTCPLNGSNGHWKRFCLFETAVRLWRFCLRRAGYKFSDIHTYYIHTYI